MGLNEEVEGKLKKKFRAQTKSSIAKHDIAKIPAEANREDFSTHTTIGKERKKDRGSQRRNQFQQFETNADRKAMKMMNKR